MPDGDINKIRLGGARSEKKDGQSRLRTVAFYHDNRGIRI